MYIRAIHSQKPQCAIKLKSIIKICVFRSNRMYYLASYKQKKENSLYTVKLSFTALNHKASNLQFTYIYSQQFRNKISVFWILIPLISISNHKTIFQSKAIKKYIISVMILLEANWYKIVRAGEQQNSSKLRILKILFLRSACTDIVILESSVFSIAGCFCVKKPLQIIAEWEFW